MQVSDLAADETDPPFQAGHAGSIPVTRSKALTSTNAEPLGEPLKSGTSHPGFGGSFAERDVETAWDIQGAPTVTKRPVTLERITLRGGPGVEP